MASHASRYCWGFLVSLLMVGAGYGQALPVEDINGDAPGHDLFGMFYGNLDWYDQGASIGTYDITLIETPFTRYWYDSGCQEYWREDPQLERECGYLEWKITVEPHVGFPFNITMVVYRGGAIWVREPSYLQFAELKDIIRDAQGVVANVGSQSCFPLTVHPEDDLFMLTMLEAVDSIGFWSSPQFFNIIPRCGDANISGGGGTVNVTTFDPGVINDSEVESEIESSIADLETDFEDVDTTVFDDVQFLGGRVWQPPDIQQTPIVASVPLPLNGLGAATTDFYVTDSTAAMSAVFPAVGATMETYRTTFRAFLLAMWGGTLLFITFRYFREM